MSVCAPPPYLVIGDGVKHLSDLGGVLRRAGDGPGGVEGVAADCRKAGVEKILLLSGAEHRGGHSSFLPAPPVEATSWRAGEHEKKLLP